MWHSARKPSNGDQLASFILAQRKNSSVVKDSKSPPLASLSRTLTTILVGLYEASSEVEQIEQNHYRDS